MGRTVGMDPLSWMADPSERELRAALGGVLPELACESIVLRAEAKRGDPRWHSGSAVIGGAFVAKFAWSRVAAGRNRREGQMLLALRSAAPHLQLPEVVAISTDPAEDTEVSVRRFLARNRALGSLQYLGGGQPERELRSVWKSFYVLSSLESGQDTLHSAPVRIYDRSGTWVATLHAGADLSEANLLHDIRVALKR